MGNKGCYVIKYYPTKLAVIKHAYSCAALSDSSFFFHFFLFRIIIYKSKVITILITKGNNNYIPFQKN